MSESAGDMQRGDAVAVGSIHTHASNEQRVTYVSSAVYARFASHVTTPKSIGFRQSPGLEQRMHDRGMLHGQVERCGAQALRHFDLCARTHEHLHHLKEAQAS